MGVLAALAAAAVLAAPPPAQAYARATASLDAAVAAWGGHGPVPRAVADAALAQERAVRALVRLAGPPAAARDDVIALRDLAALSRGWAPRTRVVVGAPAPPLELLRWYRQAQHRFGVPWNVLAAVNFVESAFGKLRNDSVAGAQGPMQFMPATWRAYGLGGNVHDPHDAILGAAAYLRAGGAPGRLRDALFHYNPSRLYVDAVVGFARRIGRGVDAFLAYYSWPVYVRTASGVRRVTGPAMVSKP